MLDLENYLEVRDGLKVPLQPPVTGEQSEEALVFDEFSDNATPTEIKQFIEDGGELR